MGKGKGEPEYWAAVVKPGTVLFEIGGVTEEAARMCFARLAHKMPVRGAASCASAERECNAACAIGHDSERTSAKQHDQSQPNFAK